MVRVSTDHLAGWIVDADAAMTGTGLISPEWLAFCRTHGRMPSFEDTPRPWMYKGWSLYYVILLQTCNAPAIPQRWGYLIDTLMHGVLPSEGIPWVTFHQPYQEAAKPAFAQVQRWVSIIERDGGGWRALVSLLEWLGWSLGVHDSPPELRENVCETLYREVNLRHLLVAAGDYLGTLISQRFGGGPNAFFPTPQGVCNAKAEMVFHDARQAGDTRALRTLDPCCGTGRMLLSASNYTMRLTGADIDTTVLLASRINMALYVPWGLVPIPDDIFDNTRLLTEQVGRFRNLLDTIHRLEPVVEPSLSQVVISSREPIPDSRKAQQISLFNLK